MYNVLIDQISPHSLVFQIPFKLTSDQLLRISELCTDILAQYSFDDYILSKARLDTAYMKAIDKKPENEA